MANTDTLTAYRCTFSYLQRNNPLIEEQREAIQSGKKPEFSVSDFMEIYEAYTETLAVGEHTYRAILLGKENVSSRTKGDVKIWNIKPGAGKHGKHVTVVKRSGKKYDFGTDVAALYDYHVFIYEGDEGIIAIFHRQNGSGCKSVFLETANKSLKQKGLKLDMELIVPMTDAVADVMPTKIILQFIKKEKSSDIADDINGPKKKQVIREIGINLDKPENNIILEIVRRLQMRLIGQPEAFALIKEECNAPDEYNDADVRIRIGNRFQTVRWNEFENIIGIHDISIRLHEAYLRTHDYDGELAKLSDEYYEEIIKSEEVL